MAKIVIEMPGEPQAKQRPRLGRGGKVYTPADTRYYERALAWEAKITMADPFSGLLGIKPFQGPVRFTVTAFMSVPKSWSSQQRNEALAGLIRPTSKPDWDNIGKIAADALNGIAYIDDSQIVTATVSKVYAATPALRVEIEPLFDKAMDEVLEKKEPVGV